MSEYTNSVRVCGMRCHFAKRSKCVCWCGGLFHGESGQAARTVFRDAFGEEPKGEKASTNPLHDRWVSALDKARRHAAELALVEKPDA